MNYKQIEESRSASFDNSKFFIDRLDGLLVKAFHFTSVKQTDSPDICRVCMDADDNVADMYIYITEVNAHHAGVTTLFGGWYVFTPFGFKVMCNVDFLAMYKVLQLNYNDPLHVIIKET